MKFLILNGPNLNMLGVREPGIYGTVDYEGMVNFVKEGCAAIGVETEFYQSNHEGSLVDAIQSALGLELVHDLFQFDFGRAFFGRDDHEMKPFCCWGRRRSRRAALNLLCAGKAGGFSQPARLL